MNKLSNEITLEIFSSSLRFSSLFNPSLRLGHLSPWAQSLRHKKALVLVSKRWNMIATPLLYKEVVLRRACQLHALVHTLIDTPLALHIQEITIDETCCVHGASPDMFFQNLRMLLQSSHNISTFKFRSLFHPDIPAGLVSTVTLPRLTRLALGPGFTSEQKGALMAELSESLTALDIHLFPHDEFTTGYKFPRLQELKVTVERPPGEAQTNGAFTAEWNLPLVEKMIIVLSHREMYLRYSTSLRHVIERHGKFLKYLELRTYRLESLQDILYLCPNLEHIAIDYLPLDASNDGYAREIQPPGNLKVIDVFTSSQTWDREGKWLTDLPSVRLVHFYSRFNYGNILPPGVAAHSDSLDFFKEAFSWLMPELDLSTENLPGRLMKNLLYGFNGACAYVVHQPSPYHPRVDQWGLPSALDELEDLMYLEWWDEYSGEEDGEAEAEAEAEEAEEGEDIPDYEDIEQEYYVDSESSLSETSHESDISESCKLDVWFPEA